MDDLDKDRVIDARLIESDDVIQPNASHQIPSESTTLIQEETRRWAVLLHLSTLLGLVSFGLGLIVPIVLWQWKKTELPAIDAHGKVVANAILSYFAYSVLAFFLLFVLIGFALFWVLGILFILYPLIGQLKHHTVKFGLIRCALNFLNKPTSDTKKPQNVLLRFFVAY